MWIKGVDGCDLLNIIVRRWSIEYRGALGTFCPKIAKKIAISYPKIASFYTQIQLFFPGDTFFSLSHATSFWRTVTSDGPPYATEPLSCLSCLSVTYCGQTVGWIKMPLGRPTEVGLGPGDIVLDGDPAPPLRKGAQQPPTFRPMSIVAKRGQMVAHLSNCWALVFIAPGSVADRA